MRLRSPFHFTPVINCADPMQAEAVLLTADYCRTSSFGEGPKGAPDAIMNRLIRHTESFDPMTGCDPHDRLRTAHRAALVCNDQSPQDAIECIAKEHGELHGDDRFVLMVGGDHGITNGPLLSLRSRQETAGGHLPTILHIDAHLDLRVTDDFLLHMPIGRFSHACVMRRAVELGFRVVHVGTRSFTKAEYDFAYSNGHALFDMERLYRENPSPRSITRHLTADTYVSLDVSGIDPAHMPATPRPVPGGLSWHFTETLLRETFAHTNVIGADIVEVSPREGDQVTEWGAAQLIVKMLAFHAEAKRRRTEDK